METVTKIIQAGDCVAVLTALKQFTEEVSMQTIITIINNKYKNNNTMVDRSRILTGVIIGPDI